MKFAIGFYDTKLLENGDEAAVRSIYAASFAPHNDADFESAWRDRKRQSSMGLFYKATLIGFGIVEDCKLAFLSIDRDHQGAGAGSKLLAAILDTLTYCYLVPVNNIKVINWYQFIGFVIRLVSRTYAADEAHFIMEWYATTPNCQHSGQIKIAPSQDFHHKSLINVFEPHKLLALH